MSTKPKPKSKPKGNKPKGKGNKPAKSKSKDAKGTQEEKKDLGPVEDPFEMRELREKIRSVTRSAQEESRLLNDYQQQKEKIDDFWKLEKEKKVDMEMTVRSKLKEQRALEEEHAFALKTYHGKKQHLLHEHQATETSRKIDMQSALTMLMEEHRDDLHHMSLGLRELEVLRKERQVAHYHIVKDFKQEQEKKIMALRKEYERRAEELRAVFLKKESGVRSKFEIQRKKDVKKITDRKDEHIRTLMAKHKKEFEEIKNYYRDITHNNLDFIKQLKRRVTEALTAKHKKEKELSEIRKKYERLDKPLQDNNTLLEKLKEDVKNYNREKLELERKKRDLIVLEEKLSTLTWEHDILEQRHEQLVTERDELKEKLQDTVYDVQQKSGFRNLLLEKKISLLEEQLEKTDGAVSEVIKQVRLPAEVVADFKRNLTDVIAVKDQAIHEYEDRLGALKQEYYDMINAYEAKLQEHDIPVEELGFAPPHV